MPGKYQHLLSTLFGKITGKGPIRLADPNLEAIEVFTPRESGYFGYRIPAIISLPSDNEIPILCLFAEARKKSLSDFGKIDMVMKRSTNGGKTWEPMQILFALEDKAVQNPCPIYDPENEILHLYVLVDRAAMYHLFSKDRGLSWSEPEVIPIEGVPREGPEKWYLAGPSPGHGIYLKSGPHKGRMVIAGMYSVDPQTKHADKWGSFLMFSDDGGYKWKLGKDFGLHSNESFCEEIEGGSIFVILRPNRKKLGKEAKENRILFAISQDGGETTDEPRPHPDLLTPICQSALLSAEYRGKHVLLHSGPNHHLKRIKMTVKASFNAGKSFDRALEVYSGPTAYSDMCAFALESQQYIGLAYEAGVKHSVGPLYFTKIPMDKISD